MRRIFTLAAQHTGKSKRQVVPLKSAPLVGKVICTEYGRSMVRSVHISGETKIANFQCHKRTVFSGASCFRGTVLETDIEAYMRKKVLEHTRDLYEEHSKVDRTVRRLRAVLRAKNFFEQFLAENQAVIRIRKDGKVEIKR